MAHSYSFKKFIRILQQARRMNLHASGSPPPQSLAAWRQSRRRFIGAAAAAGASSLLLTSLPATVRAALAGSGVGDMRIAVIGAGLAGLNAAYQLKNAGLYADVYEASERLGGRVLSLTSPRTGGLTVELGGELINTDHADMLALVTDFGLSLFDRGADAATTTAPGNAYYFDDRNWDEAELALLLQPLVAQISTDAQLIDDDWDTYAPQFDRLSVSDYLDLHASLIPRAGVRVLFENTIRVEYGAEPERSSALQLLFLLPSVEGRHIELLGYSDEAYTVHGGNGRIIDGLANALSGQIHTGMALTELEAERGEGYELTFANGDKTVADIVILTLPFTVLRQVRIEAPLPARLRQFIKRAANLGTNEKLLAGFNQRVWRAPSGFALGAWTDLGFGSVWDGTQRQSDRDDGMLTYYLGGSQVQAVMGDANDSARAGSEFTEKLSHFIAELQDAANGNYIPTRWTNNRHSKGAYVNYEPGQLTRFGEYFWIEADNPDDSQAVHVGGLVFAGEHLSDEYYGFMNGAAQTGRLAAQLVQQMVYESAASK